MYCNNVTIKNIHTTTHFDLTEIPYHGGSTLSSGALPKWDLLNGAFMIKRCTINEYGHELTDAANEELIYLFCKLLGIPSAIYRVIFIKYKDAETKQIIESKTNYLMSRGKRWKKSKASLPHKEPHA